MVTQRSAMFPFYKKAIAPCSPQQFCALMHTLQRDYGGVWPATPDYALEICAVENERFDDPLLFAGWAIYTLPEKRPARELKVAFTYEAATIELFDLPGERVSVYFTDGQEPGNYTMLCIGAAFEIFVDLILAGLGILEDYDVPDSQMPDLPDRIDQLVLKWSRKQPDVSDLQMGNWLRLPAHEVRVRRLRLKALGYGMP